MRTRPTPPPALHTTDRLDRVAGIHEHAPHVARFSETSGELKERLRGVVLLAGSMRPSPLQAGVARSVLDLPIKGDHSLLDHWHASVAELLPWIDLRPFPIRILLDRATAAPAIVAGPGHTMTSLERDPVEYRGTGGVLRDLAVDYDNDDFLLVATAAQLLEESLLSVVEDLGSARADITLISHRDRTPSGLMLVRCGCLKRIAARGFVDMKEQAIPALAIHHDVRVVEREHATGVPVRSLAQYIDALRRHHRHLAGDVSDDPFQETWRSTFSIVESGASVHTGARIHDSVILGGARVEDDAVVVGSVVCSGAVVRKGQMVVDRIIVPTGRAPRAASPI